MLNTLSSSVGHLNIPRPLPTSTAHGPVLTFALLCNLLQSLNLPSIKREMLIYDIFGAELLYLHLPKSMGNRVYLSKTLVRATVLSITVSFALFASHANKTQSTAFFFLLTFKFDTYKPVHKVHCSSTQKKLTSSASCLTPTHPPPSLKTECFR